MNKICSVLAIGRSFDTATMYCPVSNECIRWDESGIPEVIGELIYKIIHRVYLRDRKSFPSPHHYDSYDFLHSCRYQWHARL